MRNMEKIRELVGDITAEDLACVDIAVAKHVGIFVPSIGFCKYAIIPQHTHPAYMFNLFLESEHCIIEQQMEVPPNYYLSAVLSPDIPHEEKMGDSFTRYYAIMIEKAYFDKEYASYFGTEPPEYIWKQFLVSSEVMFYLKQFMNEYERSDCNTEKILEPLSMLITQELIRSLLKIEEQIEPLSKVYEIERVEQYMHQHFAQKLTNIELAEVANMSLSHFNRIFKRETSLSPMDYLINIRVEKAKKFLKSKEKTITDIALSCGFNSASHFSACFKNRIGQTATMYRKKYFEQDFETKR